VSRREWINRGRESMVGVDEEEVGGRWRKKVDLCWRVVV